MKQSVHLIPSPDERMMKAVAAYFSAETRVSQSEVGSVLYVELGGTLTIRELFQKEKLLHN